MAIESVRGACQQMGVKEFFQSKPSVAICVGVKWFILSHQMKQNLKKWFQPIRIEKIVDLVKRDFLIGGIEYEFNLKKFIDINVRDREIWLDKRNNDFWLVNFRMASGDAAVAAQTLWAMRTDKVYMAFEVSFWLVDQSENFKASQRKLNFSGRRCWECRGYVWRTKNYFHLFPAKTYQ